MVDVYAALMNGLNILFYVGSVVYSAKWLHIFRGGMMQKALQALFVSVVSFLLAAIARAALVWGLFPPSLESVDISVRTFALVFLLFAIMTIVNQWSNIGKATKPRGSVS